MSKSLNGEVEIGVSRLRTLSTRRNALLCSLLLAVCALAVYPVSSEGYLDDFSYAKTALDFAQKGHLVYNQWATAMLGWQVLWGALFIKFFGFSFTILRLSTLLLAMASVYLFHRILTSLGITQRNASIGALTLGLSPLYLPSTLSFMTDVPGLFVLLLCMYACLRAVAANSDRACAVWLICAGAISLVGGTVRQTSWLGVLVIVPSAGWLLRKRASALLVALLSAAVSLPIVLVLMRWYSRQPYVMPEPSLQTGWIHHVIADHMILGTARHLRDELAKSFLLMWFLLAPLIFGWLPNARRLGRWAAMRIAGGMCFAALCISYASHKDKFDFFLAPSLYLANVARPGLGPIDQPSYNNTSIYPSIRIGITLLLVITTLIMAEIIVAKWKALPEMTAYKSFARQFFWIFVPFSLAYMLLVVPRAAMWELFGRYLLGVLPTAIVLLLLLYQRTVGGRLPAITVATLAAMAVFALADRHDFFARQRASETAVRELLAAGVPRQSISESFSSDSWIQLLVDGRMNLAGAPSPSMAAKPTGKQFVPGPVCSAWFEPLTPVLHMKYFVIGSRSSCLTDTSFPPVSYRTWLPPFRRMEYVDERAGNTSSDVP